MNLLALDTTTDVCTVAVNSRGRWFEHTRYAPRLHNRHVLPMVDDVIRAAGLTTVDVDLIAFGAGPGSFTGVRIGAAISQGIALAVGANVIPVPSSAVAAETARRISGRRGEIVVFRESRPGWHYHARYRLDDAGIECIMFDELVNAPTSGDRAVSADWFATNARAVGTLALRNQHAAQDPSFAQPYYVDGDSPWQPTAAVDRVTPKELPR